MAAGETELSQMVVFPHFSNVYLSDDLIKAKTTKSSGSLNLNSLNGDDSDKDASKNKDDLLYNNKGSSSTSHSSSRRIDEVRDLVDCGGSDLGFCDMSSKYPGYVPIRYAEVEHFLNCIDCVIFSSPHTVT